MTVSTLKPTVGMVVTDCPSLSLYKIAGFWLRSLTGWYDHVCGYNVQVNTRLKVCTDHCQEYIYFNAMRNT